MAGSTSARMVSQLRWFKRHIVQVDYLGKINQTTVGANIVRGFLRRRGDAVAVTEDGDEEICRYDAANSVPRKVPGNMTDRVAAMVSAARARAARR